MVTVAYRHNWLEGSWVRLCESLSAYKEMLPFFCKSVGLTVERVV